MNWDAEYKKCPVWKIIWKECHEPLTLWPEGYRVLKEKLYFQERLTIPSQFQEMVIQEYHQFMGHLGGEKLWKVMLLKFVFAKPVECKKYIMKVTKECPVCEACARPRSLRGPLGSTPIPPSLMCSVALDIFYMPTVKWEGEEYDMMCICIDRLSGWIVAIPGKIKGMTGAKIARKMLEYQWRPFGIPSIISSDQGSHFVNEWWKTFCAKFGIRQSFSQAYHHQANGRVERAGQQVMEILRKI